jgi:hypothetical protein
MTATPVSASRRRRWWQVSDKPAGKGFGCPICSTPLRGGGNGALASHFRSKHPGADWTAHRRNK